MIGNFAHERIYMVCKSCRKKIGRDDMGTLVDSTGGDVCGTASADGNENRPHECLYISKWVKDIVVTDPDTGGEVALSVYKDSESGGMFAIDVSYLDQVTDIIPYPFAAIGNEWIELPEPE